MIYNKLDENNWVTFCYVFHIKFKTPQFYRNVQRHKKVNSYDGRPLIYDNSKIKNTDIVIQKVSLLRRNGCHTLKDEQLDMIVHNEAIFKFWICKETFEHISEKGHYTLQDIFDIVEEIELKNNKRHLSLWKQNFNTCRLFLRIRECPTNGIMFIFDVN